jgi:CHAD domain-containing protein
VSTNATDEPSFRLHAGESLRTAVRRIAAAEVDAIIAALEGRTGEDTVHEVRKATKRLRALLRLVRDHLGPVRYDRENRAFRDAARALSPVRDAEVLVATVDRLAAGGGRRPRILASLRRAARARLDAAAKHGDSRAVRRRIAARMRRARARVRAWPIRDDGWNALRDGVQRVYGRGRRRWRAAAAKPSVSKLHEWRKRAKDLRYALDLLEPLWPGMMKALADEADALADRLGEDHDLALLRRFALEAARDGTDQREQLALIDAARRKLQADAWAVAARIYEARPPRFTRRLARYWRAWQAEVTPEHENAIAAAPSDERQLAG